MYSITFLALSDEGGGRVQTDAGATTARASCGI